MKTSNKLLTGFFSLILLSMIVGNIMLKREVNNVKLDDKQIEQMVKDSLESKGISIKINVD